MKIKKMLEIKKKARKLKKKQKKEERLLAKSGNSTTTSIAASAVPSTSAVASGVDDVTSGRALTSITKEAWEKFQSVIRRVFDPLSGIERLVKGDGEIIEEFSVSTQRQKEINKRATKQATRASRSKV